jgi:hypothetical protein
MPGTHELPSELAALIDKAFSAAAADANVEPSEFMLSAETCPAGLWEQITNYFESVVGNRCKLVSIGACNTRGCDHDWRPAVWDPDGCGYECVTCH